MSIKEGMHIGWQKPAVNKHVDFLARSICVQVSMVSNQTMVKVHTDECNLSFKQFLVNDYFNISFYLFAIYFILLIGFIIILLVLYSPL